MSTSPRLSKTNIEYGDLAWNFSPGCLHKPSGVCPVPNCWAEEMSKRQREDFHKPHLLPERLLTPLSHKKPARILVNFMGDLFGDWVDPEQQVLFEDGYNSLKQVVKFVIGACPQHTFIFLTKAPWNLISWSSFPRNSWVGASIWNQDSYKLARSCLDGMLAGKKWLSVEPLLSHIVATPYGLEGISWLAIGALTGSKRELEAAQGEWPGLALMRYRNKWSLQPPIEWVYEIVEVADKAGVKVWLKNNLMPLVESDPLWAEGLLNWAGGLRQELP